MRLELHLRKGCQAVLLSIVNDLIAKKPIKFAFVRNLIALHPVHFAKDSNEANVWRFRLIVSNLCGNNQIDENTCDLALQQYREMLVSPTCVGMTNAFDENNERLDSLFLRVIDKNHTCLLNVIKPLLLFHGTANVESGFSINKELIEDNQKLETLVALRRCKDGLKHSGGLANFEVTKEVLAAVKGSHMRYEKDLKSKDKTAENECEKHGNDESISTVIAKIKRLDYEA